jgi:hypothetical protein
VTTLRNAPTPAEVKKWDELSPGASEQLFQEYLLQLRHQRRMQAAKMALAFFGPILGFLIALSFLGISAWLIHQGHGLEGTALGVIDIVGLAGVFALGRRNNA